MQYSTFYLELAKLSASHTPYVKFMCQHLSLMWTSPQMTSTQRQPATAKTPQALKKQVVSCVWKKNNQVLSPPHSLFFHFLLLSSVVVVVAVITQQPYGIPTANDMCCKWSQMSKKSPFQENVWIEAPKHTNSYYPLCLCVCRNPDGDKMPWCYTLSDSAISWEYCGVPSCRMPVCE